MTKVRVLPVTFLSIIYFSLDRCLTNFSSAPEFKKMSSDPAYNINVTGDIKQMLKELGTEKGKEAALLGGGGSKAQKERAAALAAILVARSRLKEDEKSNSKGEAKTTQSFSIVDAASAAVHGRSAAAAKASSSDKTAARIATHMSGERTPVNAKLVGSFRIKFEISLINPMTWLVAYYTRL